MIKKCPCCNSKKIKYNFNLKLIECLKGGYKNNKVNK